MDPYGRHVIVHHGMPGNARPYPAAEATHQEVLDDPVLFRATLDRLLTLMGTKLKIPKVGGQEVDLHQLYKEVTSLGGLEQVINRKQWVTVCEPFNFPASFTNKSFVIKKLFINALHHYEQVYFHRNSGGVVPQPWGPAEPSAVLGFNPVMKRKPGQDGGYYAMHQAPAMGFFNQQVVSGGARASYPSSLMSQATTLSSGTRFSGTVDSSFEHGFHLTLELSNGQRMEGVMYPKTSGTNMPQQQYKGSAMVSGSEILCGGESAGGAVEYTSNHSHHATGATATAADSNKRIKKEGPQLTQARSALFFFASSITTEEVRAVYPDEDLTAATVKMASVRWSEKTLEERQPFLDKANMDKLRFETEYAKLSGAGGPCLSSAPPKEVPGSDGSCVEAKKSNGPATLNLMEFGLPRSGAAMSNGANDFPHSQHARFPVTVSAPPLEPPQSASAAISAAHAKAVAAAAAADAPPPLSPEALGVPLSPYPPHTSTLFHDDNMHLYPTGESDMGGGGYFNHPGYFSCAGDVYHQQVLHPEGHSSGPSPQEHSASYMAGGMLHAQPTLVYNDTLLELLESGTMEEGGDFTADDGIYETDAAFASLLEDDNNGNNHFASVGAHNNNNRPLSMAMLGLVTSGDNREFMGNCQKVQHGLNGHDHGHGANTCGYSCGGAHMTGGNNMHAVMGMPPCSSAGSPMSDHEYNYRVSAFTSDLVGGEGYHPSIFATGGGVGFGGLEAES